MDYMTQAEFTSQRDDLARKANLAQAAYESEVFLKSTGASDSVRVQQAKDAIDAIADQRRELEVVWKLTTAEAERQGRLADQVAFEAFLADAAEQFAKRKKAVQTVVKATRSVIAALAEYGAAIDEIRRGLRRFAMVIPAEDVRRDANFTVLEALQRPVAAMAFASTLAAERISVAAVPQAYGERDPVEFEDDMAARTLRALEAFNPSQAG